MSRTLIFRQLFEEVTSTFTYILGCSRTREALIVDPVIECVDRDANILKELNLNLKYAANTHVHADHVTGSGQLRDKLGCLSILSSFSGGKADLLVHHGDKVEFGDHHIEIRATPGHTDGCTTFVSEKQGMAFTGDALLIRGCGRTDFQQGDAGKLYESVHSQIFSLPSHTLLYPCHDYNGFTVSSVEEELKFNKRLLHSKEEFIHIMENLNLSRPAQIDKSLPANLVCGILEDMDPKTRKLVEHDLKSLQ